MASLAKARRSLVTIRQLIMGVVSCAAAVFCRPMSSWWSEHSAHVRYRQRFSAEAQILSQNCVGYPAPPHRVDPPQVNGEALAEDQCGQCVEIHLVDAAIDDKIARHAEYDQKIEGRIEEVVIEQICKAAKARVH